ncbi:arrestin domain-containing protein 17-like [Daphnia carinata]|uniref:arrestin domain-containing protein 17-like n=1 Tax=Daphnia carinata TaxID=120202 RepID=UPI0025804F0B|nr:arrestin domain-containing protein 17-like [Daphnia carinata]
MVLDKFFISLNNDAVTYFPGQEITGNVHIWNNESKNVIGIYVECRGLAQVSFSRTEQEMRTVYRNGRSHTDVINKTVHYSSKESYFHHRVTISAGNGHVLNKGKHQFPFSFLLPQEIPSSFEGAHGNVRYTLRAVYERRLKWNHECKIPITINSITDLNTIPEANVPVRATGFKTLGILCCKSNPIMATFWLDRAGYVPGEKIILNAEVENLTRKRMRGSKIQIIERTNFHATRATECHERVIHESVRGKFKAVELWENYPIIVPPIVSSGLNFCRIIDVTYILVFSVDPGSFSFNLKVSHNLLIGNVPLRSSFANFQHRNVISAAQGEHGNPSAIAGPSIPGAETYPDLPPPSYEECMFGGNIRDTEDSEHVSYGAGDSYKPRYLTYGSC